VFKGLMVSIPLCPVTHIYSHTPSNTKLYYLFQLYMFRSKTTIIREYSYLQTLKN